MEGDTEESIENMGEIDIVNSLYAIQERLIREMNDYQQNEKEEICKGNTDGNNVPKRASDSSTTEMDPEVKKQKKENKEDDPLVSKNYEGEPSTSTAAMPSTSKSGQNSNVEISENQSTSKDILNNKNKNSKDGKSSGIWLPVGIVEDIAGEWVCHTLAKVLNTPFALSVSKESIEKCYIEVHALLDYAWQKLNTGNWKEVPMTWRLVFTWGSISLVSICLLKLRAGLKATDERKTSLQMFYKGSLGILQACDRGLLMGAPIDCNPLHCIASAFNAYARKAGKTDSPETPGSSTDVENESPSIQKEDYALVTKPLDNLHQPPLDQFLLDHMNTGIPVKLLGIVDHWPALELWNVGYLREIAGGRTVPIEIGARYTDDSWSQALMTLDEYVTKYITHPKPGSPPGYLAQHQLLDQVPELQEDLLIPDYCHLGDFPPRLNVWIGPKGTVSPLHHDPDHNILVQIVGYKYIRLYEEDQTEYLYPHPDPLLSNTSKVDVEGPENPEQPLVKNAQYHDLILGPGEAVYIPPRCWHYVRSLSTSFSVSFWWL